MTRAAYLDTTVALYAVGRPSAYRDVSRRVLESAQAGDLVLHGSVELIQEFTFHRMRVSDRRASVIQARSLASLLLLHSFDVEVLSRSMELVESTPVRGRDAVHAATALTHGLTEILSLDNAFDGVPGLTRVDPKDL